eukprot:1173761-Prymnesium_polylepis.2
MLNVAQSPTRRAGIRARGGIPAFGIPSNGRTLPDTTTNVRRSWGATLKPQDCLRGVSPDEYPEYRNWVIQLMVELLAASVHSLDTLSLGGNELHG